MNHLLTQVRESNISLSLQKKCISKFKCSCVPSIYLTKWSFIFFVAHHFECNWIIPCRISSTMQCESSACVYWNGFQHFGALHKTQAIATCNMHIAQITKFDLWIKINTYETNKMQAKKQTFSTTVQCLNIFMIILNVNLPFSLHSKHQNYRDNSCQWVASVKTTKGKTKRSTKRYEYTCRLCNCEQLESD